ncbi:MAG TPA: adenosylcobinamide-GDP ribazoletransferase [Candidatus Latescibacteria bacterium]|nr:adenosylcobinamide-GDP ribazoletransferase [Candidatus Latescibacterota bacterium]
MKGFLLALQFLSIIPIRPKFDGSKKDLARSMVYFPLVGLLFGAVLFGIDLALRDVLPGRLASLCLIFTLILVTGGLHLDGFADTVDALSSRKGKGEMLAIMRDSRIGTIGALGLVCLLLLKLELLSNVPTGIRSPVLLLMPTMGRWSMVIEASLSPYARPSNGLGKPFTEHIGLRELVLTSLITLSIGLLVWQLMGFLLTAFVSITALLLVRYIRSKFGGATGDTLGAVNEAVEVLVLLYAVVLFAVGQ